jgi:ribonuclease G
MVHPMMAAYLQKGFPSIRMHWSMKHKQWIKIKPANTLHLVEYKFLDKDGEEIKL